MERLKRILNKLLFPGSSIVLISVPFGAALLTYIFLNEKEYSPIAYVAYVISAYSLTIVCAYIVKLPKQDFKVMLHRNQHVHRYLTDVSFKTHVSLYLSLGINLLFVAMKLFYGIRYRSVWFGTLAVYYIMLAVMRFLLLRHVNRRGIGKETDERFRLIMTGLTGGGVCLLVLVMAVIMIMQSTKQLKNLNFNK